MMAGIVPNRLLYANPNNIVTVHSAFDVQNSEYEYLEDYEQRRHGAYAACTRNVERYEIRNQTCEMEMLVW